MISFCLLAVIPAENLAEYTLLDIDTGWELAGGWRAAQVSWEAVGLAYVKLDFDSISKLFIAYLVCSAEVPGVLNEESKWAEDLNRHLKTEQKT